MDEFRGIQTALFLMLLLQFTGAATEQRFLFLAVRDGDEAPLPCNSVRDDQNNCDRTRWIYTDSRSRTAVVLVRDGQIDKQAEDKSDRLSFTENCSLVIKKLTEKDDGRYDCRQIRSGQRLSPDAVVYLSFVTMTEQKNSDEVTLNCSVSTYDQCRHTVKWLFQRQDVDEDGGDLKTSQSLCSASVTFRTSHYIQTSSYQSLKCNVTDRFTGTPQLFPFRLSGEETTPSGNNTAAERMKCFGCGMEGHLIRTCPKKQNAGTHNALWWFIFVSVALAALIMTVVAVNVWRRIKEKKTQTDEITVHYDADDDTVNYENIT
ncbi:uncharacterized protein LOC119476807 isoform X2 [Sebastes umbrosus]|uniref:uncharacterized protein LOC119476807 isoform X2 n=1 Tax=Sebastes umbrosus TaxID=72105 RepID=UPI00189F5170|nr:uncharacterized protein LOC119476807 isoform X2 [Sebastes umbrosus]